MSMPLFWLRRVFLKERIEGEEQLILPVDAQIEAWRKAFERNPVRFLEINHARKMSWWDHYLERVAKANRKGLVRRCH